MMVWTMCGACIVTMPAPAEPPAVTGLFPRGVRAGEKMSSQLAGKPGTWPLVIDVERPAGTPTEWLRVECGDKSGEVHLEARDAARPGRYWLRFRNDEGATSLLPVFVGRVDEIVEAATADKKPLVPRGHLAVQRIERLPVTVSGRLAVANEVDAYAVELQLGQVLVASIDAHRLYASPIDTTLQVTSADGFVLAEVDDSRGLDPRLTFRAEETGLHVVRVFGFPAQPNSSIRFAGSADSTYRLTLTTGPFVVHTLPNAVTRGQKASVELRGENIPAGSRAAVVDDGSAAGRRSISHQNLANWLELPIEEHASVVEEQPHGTGHVQALAAPVTVCGMLEPVRDVDAFSIDVDKGSSWRIEVEAQVAGSRLDPLLTIRDSNGEQVTRQDDSKGRDIDFIWKPAVGGLHRMELRDLHGRGGPSFWYRLRLRPELPDFSLRVDADHFASEPGKPLSLTVEVSRRAGFSLPIDLSVEGLPEGLVVPDARSEPKGDSAAKVTLEIPTGSFRGAIRIRGVAQDEKPPMARWTREASAALVGEDLSTHSLWLTLRPS